MTVCVSGSLFWCQYEPGTLLGSSYRHGFLGEPLGEKHFHAVCFNSVVLYVEIFLPPHSRQF